ncbi:MAG: acyl-[acyl-carrier-protein] thioesterase [Robiginitomaculum sp.]|nr:acyl-[acyl-carrier-protein] thioesterase [Robiginitomaculum sp.]
MSGLIETWRGEALAWEADELGHMNMRYYFDRVLEARARFAHHLGLPPIYKTTSLSTLVPTNQHIKYIKELRPGHGMAVSTGVVNLGETDITLVHVITGVDDVASATITETLSHIAVRTGIQFSWSKRTKAQAERLMIDVPEIAKPRNIDPYEISDEDSDLATMQKADEFGLQAIGRGVFRPSECDVFGHVLPTAIVGRISNSVQHLKTAWPDLDFASDDGMSGVLLEACARHKRRPKAGDLYEIRSGLRSASTHVRELCHWVLDPVSGKCWSSFVGVGCRFNLKTRRLVTIDETTLALLNKGVVKGLKP